jgi:hypothetical protein
MGGDPLSIKDLILFLFPFTTSEAYVLLSPLVTTCLFLAVITAPAVFFSGRYLTDRTSKAMARNRRSRRRSTSRTVTTAKTLRYRSDDPRRIQPKDYRLFLVFVIAFSIFLGSLAGLSAAARDVSQREPVQDMYQIMYVDSRHDGQHMIEAAHIVTREIIVLFYNDEMMTDDIKVLEKYRLGYLPMTHILVYAYPLAADS